MPRRLGQLDLDATIETKRNLPLDARQLVRNKEELLDPASFLYPYVGMLVACRDEQKLYMLINKDDTTKEESWKEIGAVHFDGTDISGFVLYKDLRFADESDIDEIIFGVNNGQTPDPNNGEPVNPENTNEGDAP